jgi:hypothetical protein
MPVKNPFVARPSGGQAASPGAVGVAEPPSVAVFVTPESLASFPVASLVVTGLWAFAKRMFSWGGSTTTVVVISLAVGLFIFMASIATPSMRPKTFPGWSVTVFIAFVNSLLLAAAALGVLGK